MICITLDSDWAPDFVIDFARTRLRAAGIRATFFLTNPTTLDWGAGEELGLHPNFAPNSSQGQDEDSILDNLQSFLPQADCLRAHRLNWNDGLYAKLDARGIRHDSSCICPLAPGLAPIRRAGLARFPIWWSDGLHLLNKLPFTGSVLPNMDIPGLKVFNFHPIHLYLNITCLSEYKAAMAAVHGYGPDIAPERLEPLRNRGAGIASMLESLLEHMLRKDKASYHLRDIAKMDDEQIRCAGGVSSRPVRREA